MEHSLVIVVVVAALVFDYINGFHDAANSIATVVSTRVLSPGKAVVWAAFFNFAAVFVFGTAVAKTMGSGMIDLAYVTGSVILAGLIGAIVWDLITWYYGLPTSSSHALIGGYAGAALATAGPKAIVAAGWTKTLIFIVLAPAARAGARADVHDDDPVDLPQDAAPSTVDQLFRRLQLVSAALYSLGHGSNDAQKTMGIIAGALFAGGYITTFEIPTWVVFAAYAAISAGTLSGGWRIIHTMGSKITRLQPVGGFAAEIGRRRVALPRVLPRRAGQHHPHHHRGHRGRRLGAAAVGGSLGRGRPDRVGVGADDPRLGDHRGRDLLRPGRQRLQVDSGGRCQGQTDEERGAAARAILDADRTAVQARQVLDDGQPETGAARTSA